MLLLLCTNKFKLIGVLEMYPELLQRALNASYYQNIPKSLPRIETML